MTILMTYPRERLDARLRRTLERTAATIYCPLRRLRTIALNAADRALVANTEYLIITSAVALEWYLGEFRQSIPAGTDTTLIVLSDKMAASARQAGVNHVLVSSEENQSGLSEVTATAANHTIVRLCGSIPNPAHDPRAAAIPRVQVYENIWNDELHRRAMHTIARGCEVSGSPIRRILATSPSAYRRLSRIELAIPQYFADPVYYTLGPSTAASVERDGRPAIAATHHNHVLAYAVSRIIQDESAQQA